MSQKASESGAGSASRNGGIMVAAMLLGRILGFLRDTVLASHFGLQMDADSFRIAFAVPDVVFMLVAGGGLSSAFIPVFSDFIHKGKRQEGWAAFSAVVSLCSIGAVILICGAWFFTPAIVNYVAAGYNPKEFGYVIPRAIEMSRILLPGQFAFLIGSILIATLYVRKQFWVGSLAPNIYNLFMVVAGMFLPLITGLGVKSMAWGAVTGAMVGNLLLPIAAMFKNGSHFRPNFNLRTPGVDRFFRLLLPVIFGFSLPSMVGLISGKVANEYGIVGLNTDFSIANNLMQAPLGIFGQALALGAFPVLAQFVSTNRMDLYRSQVSKTLRTVLYLGIPSGALMLALAPEIVHCLYGHGKASGDLAGQARISDVLQVYSVGIFLWCMQPVLMRGFFSLHKTFKPIAISTGVTAVFIILCAIALHVSKNFLLIPLSTDLCILILSTTLYFSLEREVGKLDRAGIATTILLCGAAAGLAAVISYGLMHVLHPHSMLFQILFLGLVAMIGAWVYYFATRAMKIPETDYVDRMVARARGLVGGPNAKP